MSQQIKWFLKNLPPWCESLMIFAVRVIFYYCFYRGTKYICPCCGKGSNKFKDIKTSPFSANKAEHIETETLCTYCCSLPRQRTICYFIANHLTKASGKKQDILLFAPELCTERFFRRNGITYKTSDLFRRGCDLRLDLCDIHLPDSSQDLIICSHILEHVPNDAKAMSELSRILRKSGTALIMTPMDLDIEYTVEEPDDIKTHHSVAKKRTDMFGQQDHVRLYGRDFISKLEVCFTVTPFDGSGVDKKIMPKFGPFAIDVNLLFVCTAKTNDSPAR